MLVKVRWVAKKLICVFQYFSNGFQCLITHFRLIEQEKWVIPLLIPLVCSVRLGTAMMLSWKTGSLKVLGVLYWEVEFI